MSAGAQLSMPDQRRSSRHPVDLPVIGEHRDNGDMHLHITNISAHGFMVDGAPPAARGDRIIIRLPEIGRIEAHCMWVAGDRSGFQFERILRQDAFAAMIKSVQPNPRLRRER